MEALQLKQTVNKAFAPLFTVLKRYYILMGGRGAGRSTAASQFILANLTGTEFFRCAIMRAVHKDIRHSLWRELRDRAAEQGIEDALHITDNDMTMSYGKNMVNAVGFRASSKEHSAKLKSLANYTCVVIEEADEIGEQEFMVLDDSLRTIKADIKIILCFNTPPKSHWLIQRWFNLIPSGTDGFYIPVLKPEMESDTIFVYHNHKINLDNIDEHTLKRYAAYEQTKPDYFHQVIEGLSPETVRGKIYSGWRQIDEVPFEAKLFRYGIDFGWFPDPLVLVAIYYHSGGYIIDELMYGNEIPNKTVAETILRHSNKVPTVADSAEPKSIAELVSHGVQAIGAAKGSDSVVYGIKMVADLSISVTKRSTHVWKSYENYAWKEDKDGNPLGYPDHAWSDPMDAVRYPLEDIINTLDPEQEKREERRNERTRHETISTVKEDTGLMD